MAAEDYFDEYSDPYDTSDMAPDDFNPYYYDVPYKKCPKCGSKLVLRKNSKTGNEFYGCKSFPSCKFTCKPEDYYWQQDFPNYNQNTQFWTIDGFKALTCPFCRKAPAFSLNGFAPSRQLQHYSFGCINDLHNNQFCAAFEFSIPTAKTYGYDEAMKYSHMYQFISAYSTWQANSNGRKEVNVGLFDSTGHYKNTNDLNNLQRYLSEVSSILSEFKYVGDFDDEWGFFSERLISFFADHGAMNAKADYHRYTGKIHSAGF